LRGGDIVCRARGRAEADQECDQQDQRAHEDAPCYAESKRSSFCALRRRTRTKSECAITKPMMPNARGAKLENIWSEVTCSISSKNFAPIVVEKNLISRIRRL
jgi:hypothetical protein